MTNLVRSQWIIDGNGVLRGPSPDYLHLFQMVEQPGLGREAEKIRTAIVRAPDMLGELRECRHALSVLLNTNPALRGMVAGSTTLGNRLDECKAIIKAVESGKQ